MTRRTTRRYIMIWTGKSFSKVCAVTQEQIPAFQESEGVEAADQFCARHTAFAFVVLENARQKGAISLQIVGITVFALIFYAEKHAMFLGRSAADAERI